MSFKEIKLECIQPDSRSSNRMDDERFRKLVNNIRHTKQIQPLLVRPDNKKSSQYFLIDGHHRLKALQVLDWKTAPVIVWDIDEKEAGLLLATLNTLRGEEHPQKRAELLESLLETFDPKDLAELLPESEAEILNLIKMFQLEEKTLEAEIKRQVEAEAQTLPVMLNFVLSAEEAELVKTTLEKFSDNINAALVMLCQSVSEANVDSH